MNVLSVLLQALGQIPAAFWGVVVGSFFSILGVWLSNRGSETRLRKQFDHEMALKAREREVSAKTEIYMDALSTLAAGTQAIANMSNVYQTDAEVFRGVRQGGDRQAVSKITIVASADTARAFARLNDAVRVATTLLYPRRVELVIEKGRIDRLDGFITKSAKEQEYLVEQMKQKNLAGDVDQASWAALNRAFEAEGRHQRELIDKRQALYRSLTAQQIEFRRDCTNTIGALKPRFVPVLSSIRKELDMPLSEVVLTEILQDDDEVRQAIAFADAKFAEMVDIVGPEGGGEETSPPSSAAAQ